MYCKPTNKGSVTLPADGLQLSAVEATTDPLDGINANVASSMARSTDYNNSPPGEHVQDVNSIINNSLSEIFSEVNKNKGSASLCRFNKHI